MPPNLEAAAQFAELRLADSAETLADALEGSDVLYVWSYGNTAEQIRAAWRQAGALRWIQTGGVGVDGVMIDKVVASDVIVTNTRGVVERPLAEYVLALLLLFAKDLRVTLDLQARAEWRHRETELVSGQRALVVGAGEVAREIARLLRAVGMRIDVVARSARTGDPDFGDVAAIGELDALLPRADYLILALPLTSETQGLISAERLALLSPSARIINVGRGLLIDESALLDALRSGAVAGAALDVFAQEPLPPQHPFWAMPQVVVSPHMGGDRVGWAEAAVQRFVDNLQRWLEGAPLQNVVSSKENRLRS